MDKTFAYYVEKYFMSYLIGQHGYGGNTISSYRDTFRLLIQYLGDQKYKVARIKLIDINYDCVIGFLGWLEKSRKNAMSTRNVRLAHLKSFFGYVLTIEPEQMEHCSKFINIPFGKTAKKPPVYLTEPETTHLLKAPDSATKGGLRHLAMLTLLYDSGCRVQELIELKVSDVTIGKCCRIYVHGKGNKYREIPVFGETGTILEKYIKEFGLEPKDLLFLNKQGHPLTRAGVKYVIQKYKNVVKKKYPDEMNVNVSPHILRHSKATHLVNAGVNIFNVRDFLGHASVTTTQIYLTTNPEVTRKAIEKVSERTVSGSLSFYTDEEKTDLLEFLDALV